MHFMYEFFGIGYVGLGNGSTSSNITTKKNVCIYIDLKFHYPCFLQQLEGL